MANRDQGLVAKGVGMIVVAALGLGLGPLPAAAEGTADGPEDTCRARGYPEADAFPSLGIAAFDLHLDLPFGPPGFPPQGPLRALAGPRLVQLDEGSGDTVVCRSLPLPPGCTEGCTIETEIIQLELSGTHPALGEMSVGVHHAIPSRGLIRGASVGPTGQVSGGASHFDVHVDVALVHPVLGTVRASSCLDPAQPGTIFCRAFRVEADLDGILLPPVRGVSYDHPFGESVPLWVDPDPLDPEDEFIVGDLQGGCHKPVDPDSGPEHHTCLMGFGPPTPDGAGRTCLGNVVRFVAVDLSRPEHVTLAVTGTPSGGLTVSPFVPATMDGVAVFTAGAATAAPACTDVGVAVQALYADLHAGPTVSGTWRQHG